MKITNLDMAAAITAATGINSTLLLPSDHGLTGFLFPDTPEITSAAALYFTGELSLPAKKLLQARGDLYRQLKRRGNHEPCK